MGTVWRAADQLLRRTVALKEMHLRATGEEFIKQSLRAQREAQAVAQFSHPNVINVYDLVHHDERLWLVMEFVDGASLADHIRVSGPDEKNEYWVFSGTEYMKIKVTDGSHTDEPVEPPKP